MGGCFTAGDEAAKVEVAWGLHYIIVSHLILYIINIVFDTYHGHSLSSAVAIYNINTPPLTLIGI
jgi:hypothetical protein